MLIICEEGERHSRYTWIGVLSIQLGGSFMAEAVAARAAAARTNLTISLGSGGGGGWFDEGI